MWATASINHLQVMNVNVGVPGGGTASEPLYQAFGRTASSGLIENYGRTCYGFSPGQADEELRKRPVAQRGLHIFERPGSCCLTP